MQSKRLAFEFAFEYAFELAFMFANLQSPLLTDQDALRYCLGLPLVNTRLQHFSSFQKFIQRRQ